MILMKQLSYFTFLLLFGFAIAACQGDQSSSSSATDSAAATSTTTVPPVTAGVVDHYTCPNGHAGAPAAGNCVQCGTALVHNQAFHANDQVAPPANSNPMQEFAPAAAGANSTTTVTPNAAAASPAQNAAGVYHYTCAAGCAGGAGAAGTCPSCGGALAHNQAYHN
jgi:hypothetical protein